MVRHIALARLSSGDETHAYLKERSKAQNGGQPYTTFPYVWISAFFLIIRITIPLMFFLPQTKSSSEASPFYVFHDGQLY